MKSKGFTLIELLVVIGIIGILAAIVLVAVNPGRQFAQARDTQRRSDLYSITNAVYQFAAEHNGNLPGRDDTQTTSDFPISAQCIGSGTAAPDDCYDLGAAGVVDGNNDGVTDPIAPTYIASIPIDPSETSYVNTGYTIYKDENGRLVAEATGELTTTIQVTR